MKILLCNPPCRIDIDSNCERFFIRAGSRWPFSIIKEKTQTLEYIPFPFYLAYTASLLEKDGYDVFVIDAIAMNLSMNDFMNRVSNISPDVILFETSTPTINYDIKVITELKKITKSKLILTGTHATVFPEQIMAQCKDIDYIIRWEYEFSCLELVKALSSKNVSCLENIKGLVFRKNDTVIVSNSHELIEPLDKLPIPAYHLFPSNGYNDLSLYWDGFIQYKPAIQMHSSRGCPFKCNFCLWNQVIYNNGKYRTFTSKRVVDEMEFLVKKYRVKEIYFDDDDFTANKKHVLAICYEIKNRGLKVFWSCMGDAMVTDKEMIDAMADSGCIGMKFGVESGDIEILKYIGKPINFDRVKEVAAYCAKKRIKTHATFTFGLSGETEDSMFKTLDFAKELDVDSVQFSITTPFPGTRYYAELEKRDMIVAKDWSDYDGSNKFIVAYDIKLQQDIEDIMKKASGIWLRHKLLDIKWGVRQSYNFIRVIDGQGVLAFFKRLKNAALTISKSMN